MKTSTIVILSVSALAVTAGVVSFLKRPKASITINDSTGEGEMQLGSKKSSFNKTLGASLSTWNGYTLSSTAGGGYMFRKSTKVLASTQSITPYDGGNSYVTINHKS